MAATRHRCFISYHHDDQDEVDAFVRTFDEERDVFIARALGTEMEPDIIDSDNPAYVMERIRQLYLIDSTVTLVMLGKCTWARRYVDWELQSSLRSGETVTPNGLLGIWLPSHKQSDNYPDRLNKNLRPSDAPADQPCYAHVIGYPSRRDVLSSAIDLVFNRRTTRAHLINNPRDRRQRSASCP